MCSPVPLAEVGSGSSLEPRILLACSFDLPPQKVVGSSAEALPARNWLSAHHGVGSMLGLHLSPGTLGSERKVNIHPTALKPKGFL